MTWDMRAGPLVHDGEGGCEDVIVAAMTGSGIEIAIGTEEPLVQNKWIEGVTCLHGVTFWIEPTSEQLAKWAAEERESRA